MGGREGERGGGFLFFILASPDSWRESIKIGAVIGNLLDGFSFYLQSSYELEY